MRKFFTSFIVSIFLLTTMIPSITPTAHASQPIKVEINGVKQNYSQPPIIKDFVTLIPMKELFQSLGVTDFNWNEEKFVTVRKGNSTIILKVGDDIAIVNGKKEKLLVPAQLVNNNLLIPLRFVSQTFGADVKWNGTTRTISIITKNTEQNEQLKIGLVTDVAGINDDSFNQLAWLGLQEADRKLGIVPSYKESSQSSDYNTNFGQLRENGNYLMFGIGFTMGDAILEEAQNNPNTRYAIIDYSYDQIPNNLVGVLFKEEQASFLAGYIAGKMTKTGKVGFVGGFKVPVVDRFGFGFQAGAKYANPDVIVLKEYANSFSDPVKGQEIAKTMYQDGADILFHAAGAVGDGVIKQAKEQNKYVIGVDRDQNNLAPNNVITSVVKRIDNAVYYITKQLQDGNFTGGETVVLGLAENGVDLASTTSKNVPTEILLEVEKLKKEIIDWEIIVPYDQETYKQFELK